MLNVNELSFNKGWGLRNSGNWEMCESNQCFPRSLMGDSHIPLGQESMAAENWQAKMLHTA